MAVGGSESLLPNGSADVQILMYPSEQGDDMVFDAPPVPDASPRPSEPTIVPPDLGNVSLSGPTPTIAIERPTPPAYVVAATHDQNASSASQVDAEARLLAPPPTKRGRGRPRKTKTLVSAQNDDHVQNTAEELPELPPPQPAKRGRGRPRKTEVPVAAYGDGAAPDVAQDQLKEQHLSPATAPAKRGRGRPRKIVPPVLSTAAALQGMFAAS